jgi:hypothetical protein
MIYVQTSREVSGYTNRYAAAQYFMGGGHPPRNGLVERHYYVGQILEGGRFHILKPHRLCFLSEFTSFQLVSRCWTELSELEQSLLVAVYSEKKLALAYLSDSLTLTAWRELAAGLERAGYLRWADSNAIEMSLLGEAEVQHRLFNLSAGDNLLEKQGGIRIQHHSIQEHEIDLARSSTLSVNVDGMVIRIMTLRDGGAVIRVDHDATHRVLMSHKDDDRKFVQAYVNRLYPFSDLELLQHGASASGEPEGNHSRAAVEQSVEMHKPGTTTLG